MYQLNQSKNAVIAHFAEKEKKIDLLFPENLKSINPVASMNSKTENNNSHKIDLNSPEKVKSILPVTDMNTEYTINIEVEFQPIPEKELKPLTPEQQSKIDAKIQRVILNSLPTYEKVIEDMENFIKDLSKEIAVDVFGWLSEYSRRNHDRMVVIASKLCAIEEDYYHEDFNVPEETKKEIFNIGCDIDREGGFQTQQACFYIAVNFIAPTNKRIKAIETCWSGAGSWR